MALHTGSELVPAAAKASTTGACASRAVVLTPRARLVRRVLCVSRRRLHDAAKLGSRSSNPADRAMQSAPDWQRDTSLISSKSQ